MDEEFEGGPPNGPIEPPYLRESPEERMRRQLTKWSLILFVCFTVLEVVAAELNWNVGAQCVITGAIGFFLGVGTIAVGYYFAGSVRR